MENEVPILDADGVVRIDALSTYVEVLDAIRDGQWLMVAPKMAVRLQKDLQFTVRLAGREENVSVVGTPFYWRGPFVGMKVRPASSADLNLARQITQRLLHQSDPRRAEGAAGRSASGGSSSTSYAMVDPQAENSSGIVLRQPDIAESIAETPEPAKELAAKEAAISPAGANDAEAAPPVVEVAPSSNLEQPAEVAAPAAEDPELPTAAPPEDDFVPVAPVKDKFVVVAPDEDEFVPVAPPQMTPRQPSSQPDTSEFTETDYIDLNGAATPLSPNATREFPLVEDDLSDAILAPDEAVSGPSPSGEFDEATSPDAEPIVPVEPVVPEPPVVLEGTALPAPVAPSAPAAPAVAAPDTTAAIPELRGNTVGGFTDEGLLLTFPNKQSGLPLPEAPTLYRVLSVLAAYEVSGQLTLRLGDEEAVLFLRKGTLLGIEPMGTTFDQHFGDYLLEEKAIEREPLDAAIAHGQAFDKTLPVALYEKRSIGMDVMGRVLRDLKQKIFFELLRHPEPVAFHFVARRKFGRKFDPMRVHLAGTLVEFVRAQLVRKYLADLEPLLKPYKFKYAQVRESDVIPIDVLNLDDKQRHAVKHVFHGPNRLNEAYSLCLLTRHGTARLITLLHHFGLINWLDEPGAVAGQETIEDRLKVIHRHLQAGDHFKRLEVHWGAHPRKIELALKRFSGKYAPEQALARHSDEAGQLCASIMALAQESHDFLMVKRQRRDYRLEKQGDMRVRRAAEFLVKQADLVRFRGDWDEAFDLLEAAIDMWEHPSFVSKHQQWRSERRG